MAFCFGVVSFFNFEQHVAIRLVASVCIFDGRFCGLATVLIVWGVIRVEVVRFEVYVRDSFVTVLVVCIVLVCTTSVFDASSYLQRIVLVAFVFWCDDFNFTHIRCPMLSSMRAFGALSFLSSRSF